MFDALRVKNDCVQWIRDFFAQNGPDCNAEFKKIYDLAGHLNPMGYRLMALLVESYIDYLIRHNVDDFRQIGFVGTPYYNEAEKW